jgi:hypothetical protein
MSSLVRLLLICLIAMALPVQGVAAATLNSCGPDHSSQLTLSGGDGYQRLGGHGHAAVSDADTAAHGTAADLGQHGKHGAGAHAACCVAIALPASALLVPLIEHGVAHVAPVPSIYIGPVGAGLERPPKHPRA